MKMVLTKADVIAALQAWVASTSGGSTQGVIHQMDATISPILQQDGTMEISLNV